MSSDSDHECPRIDSRFSTPAPELDDHRRNFDFPAMAGPSNLAQSTLAVPSVEVELATPRGGSMEESDPLDVDRALLRALETSPIGRDFEQAIMDGDRLDDEDGLPGSAKKASMMTRRFTNREREGRPRGVTRHDRSRESSSSRSTSPANSVEAFAEPRRRARANTAESVSSSLIERFRQRAQSQSTSQRRPTLSSIVPPALTHRTERDNDDVAIPIDDEPGKTYKIDFEELEEYVALCNKGEIPCELNAKEAQAQANGRQFEDRRKPNTDPNVPLGENFWEKPLVTYDSSNESSANSTAHALTKVPQKPEERFFLFSTELTKGIRATKLGDFVADGTTTFRDLFDVGEGVWWLDVHNPTSTELEVIAKAFKIHRLTREDIETQEAREKVELFEKYYFVCFRSFNMDPDSEDFLDPVHVYIIVTGEGVLSFSYEPVPHAKNVRRRIAKLADFLHLGPDYICYAMIDDIVDSFQPFIHRAEKDSEALEDQVFTAREEDLMQQLRQIGDCRKMVLNLIRLLGGKADVIKGFAKRCNEQYQMTPRGDIGLYLGDIQDHVVTMMSNLGHVEKMLSRTHANYLAQLNVDNILKGNATNKALTTITVLASIIVPLNIVTGLFGMNVTVPGADTGELNWFFGILGGMILFIVVALIIAKKVKFI